MSRPKIAAKRRKNAAHGASRGENPRNRQAPAGRKNGSHPDSQAQWSAIAVILRQRSPWRKPRTPNEGSVYSAGIHQIPRPTPHGYCTRHFRNAYAVLHHPDYRERYAANLRRELPRIPFVSASTPTLSSRAKSDRPKDAHAESRDPVSAGPEQRPFEKLSAEAKDRVLSEVKKMQDAGELHYASQDDARVFRVFVKAGERLAEIHVHYEKQPECPLTKTEKAGEKLDWRVTKMRLSKDKTSLIYNQFLTLSGIPKEAYEYRLGNRSALEWVIDQYQVSTDKRSGITNDPNRADDPQYILRLIGQVITVSLETVKIVRALPPLGLPD
jgi:predicted helicase